MQNLAQFYAWIARISGGTGIYQLGEFSRLTFGKEDILEDIRGWREVRGCEVLLEEDILEDIRDWRKVRGCPVLLQKDILEDIRGWQEVWGCRILLKKDILEDISYLRLTKALKAVEYSSRRTF